VSLEQRLIDTLHRADEFQPSPDLFARVERSLEEDARHRRRVGWTAAGIAAGMVAITFLLQATISHSSRGLLTAPGWVLGLIVNAIKIGLIFSLGPSLRRLGQPLIADVFRLGPATGKRFLDLLDIAFYLFLFGLILVETHPQQWGETVVLAVDGWYWTGSLGTFMLMMGLGHAATIAALPLIGVFHSSLVRRARRREAGSSAPPISTRAEQAERVVRFIVWGIAGFAFLAVLVGVGVFLVFGLLRT
jgi:hypothetical protein